MLRQKGSHMWQRSWEWSSSQLKILLRVSIPIRYTVCTCLHKHWKKNLYHGGNAVLKLYISELLKCLSQCKCWYLITTVIGCLFLYWFLTSNPSVYENADIKPVQLAVVRARAKIPAKRRDMEKEYLELVKQNQDLAVYEESKAHRMYGYKTSFIWKITPGPVSITFGILKITRCTPAQWYHYLITNTYFPGATKGTWLRLMP